METKQDATDDDEPTKNRINTEIQDDQIKKTSEKEINFDTIIHLIGSNGRWNWEVFFMTALGWYIWSYVVLSYGFLGQTPDHWCSVPQLQEAGWTEEQIRQFAIPNKTDGTHEKCLMYDFDYDSIAGESFDAAMAKRTNSTPQISCSARTFETSEYQWTTSIRWDLVCERRYLYSTTQAVVHVGMMTGALISGFMSDRFGRKPVSIVFVLLYAIAGFGGAVVPWVRVFIVTRWLSATAAHGVSLTLYVISTELTLAKQRPMIMTVMIMPWSIGYMSLPLLAYLIRNYQILQTVLTCSVLVMIPLYWLLPESIRWLVMQGRHQEALKIIKQAAKRNKRELPPDEEVLKLCDAIMKQANHEATPVNQTVSATLLNGLKQVNELIKAKRLMYYACILFGVWVATSMSYYGVSLNGNNLSSNIYLFMFLGGLIEVPGSFLKWPLLLHIGRRWTNFCFFLICGVAFLCLIAVPTHLAWLQLVLFCVSKICISPAFSVLFLHTAEIFPTDHRSFIIGACSFFGRVGSIFSPYITDLLGESNPTAPAIVYGVISVTASFLTLLLPETKKRILPDSVEQALKPVTNKGYESTEDIQGKKSKAKLTNKSDSEVSKSNDDNDISSPI